MAGANRGEKLAPAKFALECLTGVSRKYPLGSPGSEPLRRHLPSRRFQDVLASCSTVVNDKGSRFSSEPA